MLTPPKSDLPTLYLGDRSFLLRHGSTLSDLEVTTRMTFFLTAYPPGGLAAGDPRTRECASAALGGDGRRLGIHIDIPLRLNHLAAAALYPSAMAALRSLGAAWTQGKALTDLITGRFFAGYARTAALADSDIARLTIDDAGFSEELNAIAHLRPGLVTVGGDWLDLLICANRTDLAATALERVFTLAREADAQVLLSTYFGPAGTAASLSLLERFDWAGILLPCNSAGIGMFPDRERALAWRRDTGYPLYAMHGLAEGELLTSGQSTVIEALRWLRFTAEAIGLFVGASRCEHIAALASAARALLAEKPA